MKPNSFLDTNVFIFSFEYPESNSRKIIEQLNSGLIDATVCDKVVKEVVKYFEKYYAIELARLFRRYLLESCVVIAKETVGDEMGKWQGKIKEKDLEQLATVKKYGLKYLVSYDRDFEEFDEYVTPKKFIEILGLKPYETEF